MARGGVTQGRRVRACVVAAALAGAAVLAGPAVAAHAADQGVAGGTSRAGAVDQRHLGPVSTAAIGGVLAAGALWARRRRSDAST